MFTQSSLAKQAVKTAKSFGILREKTQEKWDVMLATNAMYTLFEEPPSHPYTRLAQSAVELVDDFQKIIAALLDLPIGSGNLREEFDKLQATRIYDGIELDVDIDQLRLLAAIGSGVVTERDIADKTIALYRKCLAISDYSKLSAIKDSLSLQHAKKNIKRHIEKPFIDIGPQCRSAVKEVKSLCKLLMTVSVNNIRVSSQVDAGTAPKFLKL